MTISFKELAGSPVETYSSNGIVAERKILCAWDDRQAMVAELLGQTRAGLANSGSYLGRAAYPQQTAILVKSVKVEPFQGRPNDPGTFHDVESQSNTYSGQLAALTIEYALVDVSTTLQNMISVEPGTFLTYTTRVSIEHVPIPKGSFQWEDSPEETATANTIPSLGVPVIEHQIAWYGVRQPPWDLIRACSGCVNASPFLGAAEETVRFDGATAQHDSIQIDASGQPQFVWLLKYVFRERTVKYVPAVGQPPIAYGWNYAYDPWIGFQRLVDATGARLYPSTDFSGLFMETNHG